MRKDISIKTFNRIASAVVSFLCAIAGSFLCIYAATLGFGLGLGFDPRHEGSWNPFIGLILLAWIIGAIIAFIIFFVCVLSKSRLKYSIIAPLILPFIIVYIGTTITSYLFHSEAERNRKYERESNIRYNNYYQALKNNPEIAIKEDWISQNDERNKAFVNSLTDSDFSYDANLIAKFYREYPQSQSVLFSSSACDSMFLSEHFQEVYDSCRKNENDYQKMWYIIKNKNTPIDLIEEIACDTNNFIKKYDSNIKAVLRERKNKKNK